MVVYHKIRDLCVKVLLTQISRPLTNQSLQRILRILAIYIILKAKTAKSATSGHSGLYYDRMQYHEVPAPNERPSLTMLM